MDVFALRNQVIDDYARYVRSFFEIHDPPDILLTNYVMLELLEHLPDDCLEPHRDSVRVRRGRRETLVTLASDTRSSRPGSSTPPT